MRVLHIQLRIIGFSFLLSTGNQLRKRLAKIDRAACGILGVIFHIVPIAISVIGQRRVLYFEDDAAKIAVLAEGSGMVSCGKFTPKNPNMQLLCG